MIGDSVGSFEAGLGFPELGPLLNLNLAVVVVVEIAHHLGGGALGIVGDGAGEGEDLILVEETVAVGVNVLEHLGGELVDFALVAVSEGLAKVTEKLLVEIRH